MGDQMSRAWDVGAALASMDAAPKRRAVMAVVNFMIIVKFTERGIEEVGGEECKGSQERLHDLFSWIGQELYTPSVAASQDHFPFCRPSLPRQMIIYVHPQKLSRPFASGSCEAAPPSLASLQKRSIG